MTKAKAKKGLDWEPTALAPATVDKVEFEDYWNTMNHLSAYITHYYGPRCPSVGGGCCCCQAWAVYDLARAVFMDPE